MKDAQVASPAFSLVRGGPFHRLMLRTGLARHDAGDAFRQGAAAIVLTWVPLVLLELLAGPPAAGQPVLLHSFAVHARLLVSIPCFFVAESSLHLRTARCIERFANGGWAPGQGAAIARITASVSRSRDAWQPEALLLATAILSSEFLLWGVVSPIGAHGTTWTLTRTPAELWFGMVALPTFQFLALRWLWRWGLWTVVLVRFSRLHVRPIATHPDRRGGLVFLCEPAVGFSWVVLGTSAVMAGAWATRIVYGTARMDAFLPQAVILVAASALVALGPLACFTHCLWRARFEAMRSYGALAADYTRRFERRWIGRADMSELLGSPDIQSLADLANSYDVLRSMKYLPMSRRSLIIVIAAAAAPVSLLIFTEVPLVDLMREMGQAWFGRWTG